MLNMHLRMAYMMYKLKYNKFKENTDWLNTKHLKTSRCFMLFEKSICCMKLYIRNSTVITNIVSHRLNSSTNSVGYLLFLLSVSFFRYVKGAGQQPKSCKYTRIPCWFTRVRVKERITLAPGCVIE